MKSIDYCSSQTNIFLQVSSVSLASEDPVDEASVRNYYLGIADYFFTGELRISIGLGLHFYYFGGDPKMVAFIILTISISAIFTFEVGMKVSDPMCNYI